MSQKTEIVEHENSLDIEKSAKLGSEEHHEKALLCSECQEEIQLGQEVAFKRERTAEAETFHCHRKCFQMILAKTF